MTPHRQDLTVKIVIAPDSYKGSIYAPEVAHAMREGVLRAVPDAETVLFKLFDDVLRRMTAAVHLVNRLNGMQTC